MPSATRHMSLLVGSVVLGLAASEAFLRAFHPLTDPYHREKNPYDIVGAYVPSTFQPNLRLTFETEPGLPGMSGEATSFTVNSHGFRGNSLVVPKPDDEVRIFMVGGSSTECLYLDDADAVTRVLQNRLADAGLSGARVYGAARSGDASFDHVARMAHRLVHLEPDLLIVFPGVNDLRAAIVGRDYLHLPPSAGEPHWSAFTALTHLGTELQLARLAYAALKPQKYADVVERIWLVSDYRRLVAARQALPVAVETPPTDVPAYVRNLLSMIGVAKAHGFRLVFMTQATTWNSPVDDGVTEWQWMAAGARVQYPVDRAQAAMEAYNDAVRELGARYDVPVFDLAARLTPSLENFYDDVHFNIGGAATAGSMLAGFLLEKRLVSRTWTPPRRVLEPSRGLVPGP